MIFGKSLVLTFILIFGLVLAACAPAPMREGPPPRGGGYGQDILERIDNQQGRINQGVSSGQLTRREAGVLRDNLKWIRNRFRKLTADGLLTEREVANLNKMLNDNSEMIYEKKHNIRRLY